MRSSRLVPLAAVALTAAASSCAGAAGGAPPADLDREVRLDVEEAWTGRTVAFQENFVLSQGESVRFGARAPILEWIRTGEEGVVVQLIFSRVPYDGMPPMALREGATTTAGPCSIYTVKTEPGPPRKATLRVSCGPP